MFPAMPERILSPEHQQILDREREVLSALGRALASFDAEREDLATLDASIHQLDELFLVVVVGEFNSGKSTFINALLGAAILEEGVTPTTSRIHRLVWGEEPGRERVGEMEEHRVSAELLRQVEIVDTPGTNALDRQHETLTKEFVPRSDLVLFVTSADRPFTESERQFIDSIRQWGKKLVFVVNKVDFLRLDEDALRVVGFVEENSRQMLGYTPPVFPVSSRRALEARQADGGIAGAGRGAWETSRFAALERYLVDTLDEEERVRLKLSSPLGVARRLSVSYREAAQHRLDLLREDIRTLESIDGQIDIYREDLEREFRLRLADIETELGQLEKRGASYFDDTMRLPRVLDLLNKSRLEAEFERKVIADTPREVERRVDSVIDWLVASELQQWKTLHDLVERRRSDQSGRLLGGLSSFDYDREKLLDTLGRSARRTVDGYDREQESRRVAEALQGAVAETAVVEVGALGLGAVVGALATTQLVDVTGILAASTLAVLGLFILPARKKKAKAELAERVAELAGQLTRTLGDQFVQEVAASTRRLRDALAPYTRFVRAERGQLEERRDELDRLIGELDHIRADLGG